MEQEMTLDIIEFFEVIRKRIVLILVVTMLATLASGLISFYLIKPVYESSTTIIIGKRAGEVTNESDIMMFQNLIKTYSEIAKSDSVAKIAVDNYGLDMTIAQLKSSLRVTPQTGTQILLISTQNPDAEHAAEAVNALASAFIQESERLLPTGAVQVMDKGSIATIPVKPNKELNIAIAFFIGLMVSVGIALLMKYMDRTIKSERDMEKYIGLPIVGVISKHQLQG